MFWANSPSTDSYISADNLARAERYTVATAGSNGDFYVTLTNASGLADNDMVHILFPSATDNTAQARLSMNGGTTYYDIHFNTGTALPAIAVEGKPVSFRYESTGTYWFPVVPVSYVSGSWRVTLYPDGRARATAKEATLTMAASSAFGSVYYYRSSGTDGVGLDIPAVFSAEPAVFASLDTFATTKAGYSGYVAGTGPWVAHMQYVSTVSSGTTSSQPNVNFIVEGLW